MIGVMFDCCKNWSCDSFLVGGGGGWVVLFDVVGVSGWDFFLVSYLNCVLYKILVCWCG